MGDYVNQTGEGKNFSPAELEQQFERLPDVEYYHWRVCGCGAEILHDGRRVSCRECSEWDCSGAGEEFLCAGCRPLSSLPYPFADLLSEKRWVRLTRLDLVGMVTAAFVLGMAAGWWICR